MEPYNNMYNEDPNETNGQKLFLYMYIVNVAIAYISGYFLPKLLLEVYDSEVKRATCENFPFPPLFCIVTVLASVYIFALYLADMYYYWYNWNSYEVFKGLKVIVMTIPVMLCVLFNMYDTLASMCNTRAPCFQLLSSFFRNMLFRRECLVRLLTLTIVFLILSVFPTLLLFFAHPMNTFTLLVIHVALFYIETIIGMLGIKQASESKRSNILLSVLAIVVVIIVYVIFMWFYHVLFLRSLIKNLAFDIFSKYIPSVVIAVFGYMSLIQKGIFSKTKKEDRHEKLWLKLGELLSISDDRLNTFDEEKKEKIMKLRNLCRQPLANNNQGEPPQLTQAR